MRCTPPGPLPFLLLHLSTQQLALMENTTYPGTMSNPCNTAQSERGSSFRRLRRLYTRLFFFSSLVAALSTAAFILLPLEKGSPSKLSLSEGLFCCSVITGIISCVVLCILDYEFDGIRVPSQVESVMVWLDVCIISFLAGINSAYCSFCSSCPCLFMTGYLGPLICGCISLSIGVLYFGVARHKLTSEKLE